MYLGSGLGVFFFSFFFFFLFFWSVLRQPRRRSKILEDAQSLEEASGGRDVHVLFFSECMTVWTKLESDVFVYIKWLPTSRKQ